MFEDNLFNIWFFCMESTKRILDAPNRILGPAHVGILMKKFGILITIVEPNGSAFEPPSFFFKFQNLLSLLFQSF
jgi:hypothetical protein